MKKIGRQRALIGKIPAVNIPCSSVNTTGDWHRCCISWKNLDILESSDSVFGTYGIEGPKAVYMLQGASYYVANHIRACLHLIARGKFSVAQTIRNDYIGSEPPHLNASFKEKEVFEKPLNVEKNFEIIKNKK